MRIIIIIVLLIGCLFVPTFAMTPGDSAVYVSLHRLAGKLHLRHPGLQKDEYEIRIWRKFDIAYGEAQMLYLIRKTKDDLQLTKHLMKFKKRRLRDVTRLQPLQPTGSKLWNYLVQQDILMLPDQSVTKSQLYPKRKKNYSTVVLERDSSITVKANRIENVTEINDGEGYYFEVFSADGRREYTYDNPFFYVRVKLLIELRKVTAILEELKATFPSEIQP